IPPGPELRVDAAVTAAIPIAVRGPLPYADRRQVRRLERRHQPLVHGVVRDAVQPDLAVAPVLRGRPFDAVVQVANLPSRPRVEHSGRAPRAPAVDAD